MPRNSPLRNRVKELRERLNIRQSELSREAGVTRQTIIAIEKGRLNPSILICLKIAKLLREPVDYIFYLEPGFDYEQEARENANKPKRGRKKRIPVEPAAATGLVVPTASFESERDAAALELGEPVVAEPGSVAVEATGAPQGQIQPGVPESGASAHPGEKREEQQGGQAIWDFF